MDSSALISRGTAGRFIAIVAAAVVALALAPGTAGAAMINVNTSDDELNGDGDCSLREAVEAASGTVAVDSCTPGEADPTLDTIVLLAGMYTLSGAADEDANASGDLDVVSGSGPLRIEGAGEAQTMIDGNGATTGDRVIDHLDDTLTLADLTVQNGKTSGSNRGGGIDAAASGTQTLNLQDVTVTGNETEAPGGGIHVGGGDAATLTDSTVSDNTANSPTGSTSGGGIAGFGTSLTLDGSTVSGNVAKGAMVFSEGGGIWAQGTLTVTDSTITDNYAGESSNGLNGEVTGGGGISAPATTVEITGSTIDMNTAEADGGGLDIDGATTTATITDSLVDQNTAGAFGGGISNGGTGSTLGVTSSAITGNTLTNSAAAVTQGAGIQNGLVGGTQTATVTDSVISGNTIGGGTNSGRGAGIGNSNDDDLTVVRSTISGNSVADGSGGGLYSDGDTTGDVILVNTTMSGNSVNTAGDNGGGLFNQSGDTDVIHTTFSSNSAPGTGEAIRLGTGTLSMTLRGSIFESADTADTCTASTGTFTTAGSNVDAGSTCADNAMDSTDTENTDPQLSALADNGGPDAGPTGSTTPLLTHALPAASQAVGHVLAADCLDDTGASLDEDERGFGRPFPSGGDCDAGAYERLTGCAGVVDEDLILGDGGNNVIDGTAGGETILAGGGDDTVKAGGGADTVCGDDGEDILSGDGGSDEVMGEADGDSLLLRDGVADTGDCGAGDDSAQTDLAGVDTLTDCESVDFLTPPPPPPPPAAGPSGPSGPPSLDVVADGKQKAKKLTLDVTSDQDATLDTEGKGKVPKSKTAGAAVRTKKFPLKPKTFQLAAGVTETIQPKFKKKNKTLKKIARLQRQGKKARRGSKVVVKLTATGAGGVSTAKQKIKLRR